MRKFILRKRTVTDPEENYGLDLGEHDPRYYYIGKFQTYDDAVNYVRTKFEINEDNIAFINYSQYTIAALDVEIYSLEEDIDELQYYLKALKENSIDSI